jgi:hypothetical protein
VIRRCSIDAWDLPATNEFRVCPGCGEETTVIQNAEPDPDDTAAARTAAKQAAFERYLEKEGRL